MLSSVIEKILQDADKCKYRTIAFPTMGKGLMYNFPPDVAAKVMFKVVQTFAARVKFLTKIIFVVYDQDQPSIQVGAYFYLLLKHH